jgi:hypothetical protein
MSKNLQHLAFLSLCGAAILLTGCGGDDAADPASSPTPIPQQSQNNGDLAPASIGGETVNGHIGGTSTTFQIVTEGGTTGTYNYSENGKYLNSGDYTWVKTSSDSGVLTLSPAENTMELDYTAKNQGTYVFHAANYTENGTFSTN